MSNREKGMRTERNAVKELQKQGYETYRVKGSTRFNLNVDMFNLFDIIAIKPNETKLIQCKTNNKPNLQVYTDFKIKYPQFNVSIWVWYDRKGFTIFECG